MKLLTRRKDGGDESTVTGYWLIEVKRLFSVCILRFDGKSREAFHTHAFNCFSWVVKGLLCETFLGGRVVYHPQSFRPFVTRRTDFHKVDSLAPASWVLSFRGPWSRHWREYHPNTDRYLTLADRRVVVAEEPA